MKLTFTRWSRLSGGDGPAQFLTQKAIKALAREARDGYPIRVMSMTVESYTCPLDATRPVDLADHHRIKVHHHPWSVVNASMVEKAFLEHLTEPDDETRCRWVTRDGE